MSMRRAVLGLVATVAIAIPATMLAGGWGSLPAAAQTPPVYLVKGVAISGYDPVAYFTEKKPVKGNPAIAVEHEGAKYFFASEENRETFKKEPDKYLPQYGGYCAWAVSKGSTASADPHAWTIHDGKLFLNYNKSVKVSWDKGLEGNIVRADANWPKISGIAKAKVPVAPPAADKGKDAVKEPAKGDAPEKAAVKDGDGSKDAAKATPAEPIAAAATDGNAAKDSSSETVKAGADDKDPAKEPDKEDADKEPAKDAVKDKDKN